MVVLNDIFLEGNLSLRNPAHGFITQINFLHQFLDSSLKRTSDVKLWYKGLD